MENKEPWEEFRDMGDISQLEEGHKRLEGIRESIEQLESDGTYRSFGQAQLHEMFISACARLIYDEGFDERKLQAHHGWRKIDMLQWISIITPRRWGKSRCVSQFAFTMLLNIPNIKIGVFSPSRAQSEEVRIISSPQATKADTPQLVKMVLDLIEDKVPDQRRHTSKRRVMLYFGEGDTRTMRAYSSSVNVRSPLSQSLRTPRFTRPLLASLWANRLLSH